MSWNKMERVVASGAHKRRAPVEVGVRFRGTAKLSVSVANTLVPKWKRGTTFTAELGAGEHHGKLRLAADKEGVFAWGGMPKSARLLAYLPLPEGGDRAKRKGRTVCAFERDGEALVIALPGWALLRDAAAPAPAPAPRPAAAAPGGVRNVTSAFFAEPPRPQPAPAKRAGRP
jgi:hypothetical protein